MVTLYYQMCVNSEIFTDFVQVSPLNCGSTSLNHDDTDLFSPYFPLKYSIEICTCIRTSLDSLAITESL